MSSTPAPSDMLSELSASAHRLGVGFAAQAEAAEDWGRKLELVQLFDRCFFSVRVAIGLQLRLRREGSAPARHDAERAEGLEIERPEAPERSDAPEYHTYDERDRDRESDSERASLPLLLSTLSGVARDAGALPGPAPATLPTLRELLARVGAETAPPRRPPPPTSSRIGPKIGPIPLRARLAGSAGVALAIPPGPTTAAVRRATGPPRRR